MTTDSGTSNYLDLLAYQARNLSNDDLSNALETVTGPFADPLADELRILAVEAARRLRTARIVCELCTGSHQTAACPYAAA